MNRFFTLLLAASCLTAVGQEDLCDFESVGELTSHPYASQSENWIYHESAGLIRAYCINNADDFSVVASDNWSTTLDEHDWDRCGFEFSSLRGDTILLAANTKPGYNDNYNAWRSVKLNVMSGEIISESDPMSYEGGPLMHDYLSDQCLFFSITNNYSLVKCWSPWTNELVWTLNMDEYNELYGVNRFGSYRSGESHDFFALWVNLQPMQIHSRHKDSGALVSVAVTIGVADLFLVKLADGGDGVLALNTSTGDYQLFDGQLAELQSGHVNFFENESSSVRQIQTSDSVLSVVHTLPRNVNTPSGVSMYNDQDYACGVPDYIKVDYSIPDFELLQVCEYTPNISIFPTDANELHIAGENLLGFNAGPLNEDGTIWIASISSAAPSVNGCPDLDSDGVCDNIDAVVPNYYCGSGTVWDPTSQTCIVDESACGWQPDGNGDNLIGVNDLLDLLGVYGDTDYDQDGIWDSADDCVGEYDECGVCNGSGPSYLTIENIEILIDSVYVEQIDQWLTFEIGADTTFALSCEWQCGLPLEYQGYDYETVLIGEQCWFAENLRCESYRNGGLIQTGSEGAWFHTNTGMTAVYGEGVSTCTAIVPEFEACDEDSALSYLGRLYNGHAIHDDRGLCPVGWSVPMNEDWDVLFSFLGGSNIAGAELKSEELWSAGYHGTNSSGFNGLPGGGRGYTGVFFGAGENGYYWSASPAGAQGYVKVLLPTSDIGGGILDKNYGYSVRCIKD